MSLDQSRTGMEMPQDGLQDPSFYIFWFKTNDDREENAFWLCIRALYQGFVSGLCVRALCLGFVSGLRIRALYQGTT
jgi:hypothetical protein